MDCKSKNDVGEKKELNYEKIQRRHSQANVSRHEIPCDRLVSNHKKLTIFAQDYTNRSGQSVELTKLAHHMLNLRRRGQARGGLSRLQRAYNGRN